MRIIGRVLTATIGLALLAAGSFGLLSAYLPEAPLTASLSAMLGSLLSSAGLAGSPDRLAGLQAGLAAPALRFALAPLGIVLAVAALWPRRGAGEVAAADDPSQDLASTGPLPVEKKLVRKAEKQAAGLARKGQLTDAAELLFSHGALDKAADYFIQAGEHIRAAEIRHDQNRFVESAELYLAAGRYESAGSIFGQQEEYLRAAECYLEADSTSVAAEMFEKAGEHGRAARCYQEAGFQRHAAQAYVKCKSWAKAAACLEEVFLEESTRSGGQDAKKDADLKKLVSQAGKLHRRAGNPEAAVAILERGGCFAEAAEVALELEHFGKAAELFRDAGDPPRAAEALRAMGESEEAARILGEHHRDRGEIKEAAACLEEAGDFLAAGDLYRGLEEYARAGFCYDAQHDYPQSAEMHRLADDRIKAAEAYERAGLFAEAAECCALEGLVEKEAELLEKAGLHLRAGEVFHREGHDDDAIRVLQSVAPESEGFSKASALLGDIFRARGQLSLAVKKLKQALGGQDLCRDNLPIYYTLATVLAAHNDLASAVDIYEKILTLDYHYEDVEQRLVQARERIGDMPVGESGQQAAASATSLSVQGQPGRYQVVGELGRGGMGIVYKAKDTVLDRLVAYKVLPGSLEENPQGLQNFLREAKAAAKLNHPGIVTVYDAGEQDGRYYIAMEYVDGTTIKEIVRRRGPIASAGILHVLVQICEALAYAHEQRVVHRDIKTANAMWTRDKKAKIMDFGLAKVMEEVRNHTTVVSGTPYYMSPEQTLGKNVDHRTDIYSLGVSLFEMATGTVPFRDGNIPYHHVHTPPPDVRELREDISPALVRIIQRCLLKDPAERYQSVREILSELRAALS